MYLIRKNGDFEINFIVETKDVESDTALRGSENLRIASAKKFFETLKSEGLTVTFEKQFKRDDIVGMIERMVGQ